MELADKQFRTGATDYPSVIAAPTEMTGDAQVGLPVAYVPQQPYHSLCWAACAAMITGALKRRYPDTYPDAPDTLCGAVSARLHHNCCPTVSSDDDLPRGVDDTLIAFGLGGAHYAQPFGFQDIVNEVGRGRRPVLVVFTWDNTEDAHIALIVGYDPDGQWVYVHDPLYGAHWRSMAELQTAYGQGGSWTDTYYDLGQSL